MAHGLKKAEWFYKKYLKQLDKAAKHEKKGKEFLDVWRSMKGFK